MISKAKAGLATVALASAAFAGPALAQDTGFYIGAHIGQSELDSCGGFGPGVSCDDKDTGWKILGGFQFNRNFAVEVGYADLGEASASGPGGSAKAEATAWDVVAVGSLPIMDRFSVYGKLGLFYAEVDASGSGPGFPGGSASSSENESGLTFGIGLRYDFTRNLGVRAEWQRYQEVADDTDVDLMSIGVIWRF